MLNLIDQIIEIDKNARDQVASADEEARHILDDAAAKIQALQKEFDERVNKRLSIVNETYSRFADEEIGGILQKQEERVSALKNVMEENKTRYEKEILNRILGSCAEKTDF